MNQNQEKNQAGRRTLFTGTGIPAPQEPSVRISEVADIIRDISERDEHSIDAIPPLYEPVVARITSLNSQIRSCTDECKNLETRILENNKDISNLQTEKEQIVSERDLYLNDLITSHTEFDRALEIFQYHEVPMVLTGPDRTVHDANDVFCTLFSLARSEITTSHPPLTNWFPDNTHKITGPDNEEYFIISLTPPIVPFDHEAISLILLVQSKHFIQDTHHSPVEENVKPEELELFLHKPDPASFGFNNFPIPAVIINEYRIIISCNIAFCRLVARSKETILYRDIGSTGIRYTDAECIGQIFSDHEPCSCESVITHPNGNEIPVFFEINPLRITSDEQSALIVGVALDEEPVKKGEKPSDDLIIRMLLDLNPSAAALLDDHARVLSANEGFSEMTGLSPGDLCGTDVRDLGIAIPDSVLLSGATEVKYLPDTIRIQSAWGMQESSGMVVPVGSSGSGISGILIIQPLSAPISPVKNPSDSLIIRMLLDLNPSAAALLDDHARVISANEGFSEMTGLSPGDLNGTDVRDLGIAIPDSVLLSDATEVKYLPDIIRIQSAWGMQESSGMVVPVGSSESGITGILIIQPLSTPNSQVDQQKSEPPAPKKIDAPVDIDSVPVPHLVTDVSGKIIRINKAFLHFSGYQTEQLLGRLRKDVMISDTSDLVRLVSPGGELCLRELASSTNYEDGELGFWYYNITAETEKISLFKERITSLEGEIQGLKRDQVSSAQSFDNRISADEIDIVEFELNEELYAIDIAMVREVMEMLPITPLPRTPPYVTGIINLRGEVTHVIDLAILLGERPKKDRSGQKIIIIPSDVTNGEHVGIIVDNVHSVTEIQGRHVSHLGDDITTQINTHIKGIIKISHDDVLEKRAQDNTQATLVIWLDIQKILHDIQGSV